MPKQELARINKACRYYPCHEEMEDCTFCYCPFYPCLDKKRGVYIYSTKRKKKIWSCQGCVWIHKKSIVDSFLRSIRKNREALKAYAPRTTPDRGIILLAHGSRRERANKIMARLVGMIKKRGFGKPAAGAYLQFNRPDLSSTVKKMAAAGCRSIVIVPFFLFKGNHVQRDIPAALKNERLKYPGIDFIYTENIGSDAKIGEIVLERIVKAR